MHVISNTRSNYKHSHTKQVVKPCLPTSRLFTNKSCPLQLPQRSQPRCIVSAGTDLGRLIHVATHHSSWRFCYTQVFPLMSFSIKKKKKEMCKLIKIMLETNNKPVTSINKKVIPINFYSMPANEEITMTISNVDLNTYYNHQSVIWEMFHLQALFKLAYGSWKQGRLLMKWNISSYHTRTRVISTIYKIDTRS